MCLYANEFYGGGKYLHLKGRLDMKKYRVVSLIISLLMIFIGIPLEYTVSADTAVVVPLSFQAESDIETIDRGQIGIAYTLMQIEMSFEDTFQLSNESGISSIRITANGQYDETDKFDISVPQKGKLLLSMKEELPGEYFQLRKHTLYDIYIPQAAFQNDDGSQINEPAHYTFVTKGETGSAFENSILSDVSPAVGSKGVDDETEKIIFQFIDEIVLEQTVVENIENYITVKSTAINESIPSYGENDSISNYNVKAEGNKLILEAKEKKLRDFAQYTVTLQENAVHLKNSIETTIYNDGPAAVSFTTDDVLVGTEPEKGQGNVEIEPTLIFQFKYPMEIIDKDRITMYFEGQDYPLDLEDIELYDAEESEKTLLKIDIHDSISAGKCPLRKNTIYQVKIEEGALKLRDYQTSGSEDIVNREISLTFSTGNEGEAPVPIRYTSAVNGTDDIRSITGTNLSVTGNIYIKFSSGIRLDKEELRTSLLAAVHLYKLPGAETAIDPQGKNYDKLFTYVYDYGNNTYTASDNQEILVEKVEVDPNNPDTLVITPKYSLTALNQYRLTIDKEYIEDENGYNMEEDLDFLFWTNKGSASDVPSWSVQEFGQNIIQDTESLYSSYTLSGTPRFGMETGQEQPIVLKVDREVIPKGIHQQTVTEAFKVSTEAFNDITLTEGYDTAKKVDIEKYEIEYYYENNLKKTKIYLYPAYGDPENPGSYLKTQLDYGKLYRLVVPAGVFETRSGVVLSALEVHFTILQEPNEEKGIYYLENNRVKITDLIKQDMSFSIKGYNFHEQITRIILRPYSGSAAGKEDIIINREDILFQSVTNFGVKLRGSNRDALSTDGRSGTYEVILDFSGEEISSSGALYDGSDKEEKIYLWIEPKGSPHVLSKSPESQNTGIWYNEMALNHDVQDSSTSGVSFIKVVFEDVDGTLTITDINDIKNCSVQSEGSGVNLVNVDFINSILNMSPTEKEPNISKYLLVKNTPSYKTTLYIPVKTLRPQTTYQVTVPAKLVYFGDGTAADNGNSTITWSFVTTTIPFVEDITIGSVPENYDADEPIYIKGDFFYGSIVRVYFNDTRASSVSVVNTSGDTDSYYLEVYLPDGSSRLTAGSYDIIVQNDTDHQRVVYGALSVVKAGAFVPNEAFSIKKIDKKGEVQSSIRVSEDVLLLDSKYTDDSRVTLELDELMGEEVLVRKIQYDGNQRKTIGILETKSKWADAALYGVTLNSGSSEDTITICLGRVEPAVQQMLKQKLRGKSIKSDFIQVAGENFNMNSVWLNIPLVNSSGKNLKVLRYDEETRDFYEEKFSVNLVEKRMEVNSQNKGIFVVIEK